MQAGSKRLLYLTIADSYPANTAREEARETLQTLTAESLPKLEASHRQWWHLYYPKSFLSVPNAQVESYYWIQMYKLASATRSDKMPMDLMGPWYHKTWWPRVWWNLNIQLAYLPRLRGQSPGRSGVAGKDARPQQGQLRQERQGVLQG